MMTTVMVVMAVVTVAAVTVVVVAGRASSEFPKLIGENGSAKAWELAKQQRAARDPQPR